MNKIELINVSKTYTGGYGAIASASFSLERGDRLTIIGDSLSGKTTLAKLIAGLERISSGKILYDGVSNISLDKLNIGYLTDMNMKRNASIYSIVEYPLKLRGITDTHTSVNNALELFGITNLARLKIKDISPIQARLVALARLFVMERDLYILDNPIGDMPLIDRNVLINDIKNAFKKVSGSVIFFTDSVLEAERMGAMKNALLTYGVLSDVASLNKLKQSPMSIAEAKLITDGALNVIQIKTDDITLENKLSNALLKTATIGEFSNVTAVLYYDDFNVGEGNYDGEIISIASALEGYILTVLSGATELKILSKAEYSIGSKISFDIKKGAQKLYDGLSEQNILKSNAK